MPTAEWSFPLLDPPQNGTEQGTPAPKNRKTVSKSPLKKYHERVHRWREIFDNLQRKDVNIKIPITVAIGDESSGKSSMLEQIAQEKILPKGTGTVTRCPIEMRFKNTVGQPTKFTVSDQIIGSAKQVESCLDCIGKGIKEKDGFSDEAIRVTVESDKVPDMTLVDLPGLIAVSADKTDVVSPQKIDNMVRRAISNEMATILVVADGTRSFKTNPSIKMAHEIDPNGHRTIAVLTKLDLVASAPDLIANFAQALKEGNTYFPLGVFGVTCRTGNETFEEAREKERVAIQKIFAAPEMQEFDAKEHGIEILGNKLSEINLQQMRGAVSDIMRDLERQKRSLEDEIDTFGQGEIIDKREALQFCLDRFSKDFESQVFGTYFDINCQAESAGEMVKEVFEGYLPSELTSLDSKYGLKDESVAAAQIRKMEKPCLESLEKAFEIMKTDLPNNCYPITDGAMPGPHPPLSAKIKEEVHKLLENPYERVRMMVKDYIETQARIPKTTNPEFRKLWDGKKDFSTMSKDELAFMKTLVGSKPGNSPESDGDEALRATSATVEEKIEFVKTMVKSLFDIVKSQVQDQVPKIVWNHLVFHVGYKIRTAMSGFYNASISGNCEHALIQEGDDVVMKRQATRKTLLVVKEALKALRDAS